MDRLPFMLQNAIETACGQFRIINYTIHGDSDKARISIMFTNSESKQIKRKSKSTANRDNKRMKEFNESYLTEDNVSSDNVDRSTVIIEENVSDNTGSMEINSGINIDSLNSPLETPRFTTIQQLPVIDFSSDRNRDLNTSWISEPSSVTMNTDEKECKQTEETVYNKSVSNNQSEIRPKATEKKKIFTKIVLKQSGSDAGMLIGKTMTGKLLVCIIYSKTMQILTGRESRYGTLNRCVNQDFEDVRSTNLMTDEIRKLITEMEKFAITRKLDSRI